ncbi:hypothetical protein [Bremerella cremea]|uniref:hypothetical protein n=1 Tax=Bremerella cremea TaxID=1031537 RepID=UPI0031E6AEBD
MCAPRLLPCLLITSLTLLASPGCLSLSFGSKTCNGEHPETQARVDSLEQRIAALEQMSAAVDTQPYPAGYYPAMP